MSYEINAQIQAIIDFVREGKGNLVIRARAGTGKTSLLVHAVCPQFAPGVKAQYQAFNRSAANDVQERGLPGGVEASTLNSASFRAVCRHFRGRRIRVDANKVADMLKERLNSDDFGLFASTVLKLVAAAKSQGLVPAGFLAQPLLADTDANWYGLVDQFNIPAPGDDDDRLPRALDIARKALLADIRDVSTIDFDDQPYLAYVYGAAFDKNDWVLVDEAQDLNPVNRVNMRSLMKKGGRIVFVGDDRQSLYRFRGADRSSLDQIVREYDATVLPLSVTRRCPKKVVALVKHIVPDFEAHPSAPEGTIEERVVSKTIQDFRADDMVVCRHNAPLVTLAFRCIRAKIPCHVAGRDIGRGLTTLLKNLKPVDVADLIAKIDAHFAKKVAKMSDEKKIQNLRDTCDTLKVFAEENETLADVEESISLMFSDSAANLLLTSIHKAKGMEANRVFVLKPELLDRPCRTEEDREDQENCTYVAYTRTKDTLVFLSDDEG